MIFHPTKNWPESCHLSSMKQLLLFLFFYGSAWGLTFSQGLEKQVKSTNGNALHHYFVGSNQESSTVFWDNVGKGFAVAYDKSGKEIFRQTLSRHNMIQSVMFSYHPSGAVSVAHYTWHPDAGIQFGGTSTTFDDAGNKTGETKDINPDDPLEAPGHQEPNHPVPVPKPSEKPAPEKIFQQEIVEESPIYHTAYFVVNNTRKPIRVGFVQGQNQGDPHEIAPGDTLRAGEYIDAGQFGNAAERIHFAMSARNPKWLRNVAIEMQKPDVVALSDTDHKLFFKIAKTKMPFY